MSWISMNLTLDLIAIAIGGMQSAFDRIKSEPETGTEWPAAEPAQPAQVEAPAAEAPAVPAQPAAVEPAPAPAPAAAPTPAPQPAAAAPAAAAPPAAVDRLPEAQAHLRDISLAGGMDWITGTLFPSFGTQSLTEVPTERLPELIATATAYKIEKGLG